MNPDITARRGPGLSGVALALVLGLLWVVGWYWQTARDMAGIWWRSDTYAHGLVVLPIFAWLVWRARDRMAGLGPQPSGWMALPAAAAGLLWLLGGLASVAAAQHFALVTMLFCVFLGSLGWKLGRVLLFPLLFLFFAVPIGDFMLPTLMHYTAEFTVWALRLSGVPVYQEGLHFVVPNGRWSVVEACSGSRYLIASLMVGALYAYLNYRSLRRRLLFMLVAAIVPILANWLRAYMIVMIGYLSDNTLAVGVDHLLYGWVFFGIVIFLMFWIGGRWREEPVYPTPLAEAADASVAARPWAAVMVLALAVTPFPALLRALEAPVAAFPVALSAPAPAAGWYAEDATAIAYRPHYAGARVEAFGAYRDEAGSPPVGLSIAWYYAQRDDSEMLKWGNGVVSAREDGVDILRREVRSVAGGLALVQTLITSPQGNLLVWHLYRLDGLNFHRDSEVKLRLALERLVGREDASAAIVLATPVGDDAGRAGQRLEAFLGAHLAAIEMAVDRTAESIPE
ncbi:exosortase A [Thauera butanivorans]|uniref:exosortase A n=1 Tax=Thauera butanivorans TaxID=86174 RepID=UPI003AB8D7FA